MITLKERKFKMKTIRIGMGQYEMVEKAIELIQEAKELMDVVMDSNSQLSREYYAYNEAGIRQALGEGNPYDISLPKILKEIEENGEV
jgi:mevalonate kinase